MATRREDPVERMKRYLDERADEIRAIEFGKVSFDLYGGGQVKARVERTEQLPPADRLAS